MSKWEWLHEVMNQDGIAAKGLCEVWLTKPDKTGNMVHGPWV